MATFEFLIFFVITALSAGINADLSNARNSTKLLSVQIYYEALCPDSISFIRNQVFSSMTHNNRLKFANLQFIPFGKAFIQDSEPAKIYCQHGDRECQLNADHACIIEQTSSSDHLRMIKCFLESRDIDTCGTKLEIDVTAVKQCRKDRSVVNILRKYGEQTSKIDLSFVPSIAFNNTFDPWEQFRILYNFDHVFCREYRNSYNVVLDNCYI